MSVTKSSHKPVILSAVDANDVVLAVAHFSTQARGSDGIPQLVIARALALLVPYIAQVINASLTSGIFQEPWRESLLVASKENCNTICPHGLSSHCTALFSLQGFGEDRPRSDTGIPCGQKDTEF